GGCVGPNSGTCAAAAAANASGATASNVMIPPLFITPRDAYRHRAVIEPVLAGTAQIAKVRRIGRELDALSLEFRLVIEDRHPPGHHSHRGHTVGPRRHFSLAAPPR